MKYYPIELHSHTEHSDGQFKVNELIRHAIAFGYRILVITDHNTTSSYQEWSNIPSDSKTDELLVIPGIEWTTYFGHMLVIGADTVVDWRNAEIGTIDKSMQLVQKANGITGIAHPFSVGNPICTGCHWDFEVKDWSLVQFIEVWNRTAPDSSPASEKAYRFWLSLLQQGYKISCSAGRDWHRLEAADINTAVTYAGLEELTAAATKNALRSGNYYITLGPRIDTKLIQNEREYRMGDLLKAGKATLFIQILTVQIEKLKTFGFEIHTLAVIQNEKICYTFQIKKREEQFQIPILLEKGYLRIEAYGSGKGKENVRLVIANPFYTE